MNTNPCISALILRPVKGPPREVEFDIELEKFVPKY